MTTRAQRWAHWRVVIGSTILVVVPLAPPVRSDVATASATDLRSPATATERAVRTDPPSPPSPSDPGSESLAVRVIELTNQRRAAAGRPPLSIDGPLTAAAREHSDDQAARDRMSHTGSDGSTVGQRISRNGGSFRAWGENVAAGYGSAAAVVDAWMNSSGHRRNMLNRAFTEIGVGTAVAADGTRYWTMVLGG